MPDKLRVLGHFGVKLFQLGLTELRLYSSDLPIQSQVIPVNRPALASLLVVAFHGEFPL